MYIIENWVWLYWLGLELGGQYAASLELFHRIIDDRIEKSIKGRQIGHNLPYRGGCARAVLAWPPSPLTPLLHNLAVVPARRHPQTTPPLCQSPVC